MKAWQRTASAAVLLVAALSASVLLCALALLCADVTDTDAHAHHYSFWAPPPATEFAVPSPPPPQRQRQHRGFFVLPHGFIDARLVRSLGLRRTCDEEDSQFPAVAAAAAASVLVLCLAVLLCSALSALWGRANAQRSHSSRNSRMYSRIDGPSRSSVGPTPPTADEAAFRLRVDGQLPLGSSPGLPTSAAAVSTPPVRRRLSLEGVESDLATRLTAAEVKEAVADGVREALQGLVSPSARSPPSSPSYVPYHDRSAAPVDLALPPAAAQPGVSAVKPALRADSACAEVAELAPPPRGRLRSLVDSSTLPGDTLRRGDFNHSEAASEAVSEAASEAVSEAASEDAHTYRWSGKERDARPNESGEASTSPRIGAGGLGEQSVPSQRGVRALSPEQVDDAASEGFSTRIEANVYAPAGPSPTTPRELGSAVKALQQRCTFSSLRSSSGSPRPGPRKQGSAGAPDDASVAARYFAAMADPDAEGGEAATGGASATGPDCSSVIVGT